MKKTDISLNGIKITEAGIADSYFLRLRGLIGRSAKELGGLLIVPCNQIHTCFMSEAIDVLYLDRSGRVLKVDKNVPKGRFCKAVKHARSVLELPAGTACEWFIRPGDKIGVNNKLVYDNSVYV